VKALPRTVLERKPVNLKGETGSREESARRRGKDEEERWEEGIQQKKNEIQSVCKKSSGIPEKTFGKESRSAKKNGQKYL